MNPPFKTLLVDDENLALDRLTRLLKPYSDQLNLIGTASDGRQAIDRIDDWKPDLVFLDVQMPERNGFEVLQEIHHQPWIIFTTAFDEYALKAFETNSIDYLLKPIDKERLALAMEKLGRLTRSDQTGLEDRLKGLLQSIQTPLATNRLRIRLGDKIRFINLNDVVYFQATDKYVGVHTVDEIHLIDDTLYQLEAQLRNSNFVRIHRSTLINMDYVLEVFKWFGGKYKVRMKDKARSELVVSAGMKDNLGI